MDITSERSKLFTDECSIIKSSSYENLDFSIILKQNFHATINSNNDVITNKFSTISYPETDSTESTTSFIAKQFATEACNIPQNLYCPCCTKHFRMEFLLKDHLHTAHRREFKLMGRREIPLTSTCCICNAKFVKKWTLFEHIVAMHQVIVRDVTDAMTCRYCNYNAPDENMLSNHVLNIHRSKLELMTENFATNDTNILNSPGLSDIFSKMNTRETATSTPKPKSILKTPKAELSGTEPIHRAKGKSVKRKLSARRTLRFNLPDGDVSDEKSSLLKDSRPWLGLLKLKRKLFKRKKQTSSPVSKTRTYRRVSGYMNVERNFQCGHCKEMFEDNASLLLHLHILHRNSFRILQKRYRCGKCNARFYRNKYLVLHCKFHHSTIHD